MLPVVGGFAVFLSHFNLDADTRSILRLVCKGLKEQVDLSFIKLQPQHASQEIDLRRFKHIRHLDISKTPQIPVERALECCPSLVGITCHPAQLKSQDLTNNTQVQGLTVLKNRGQPPNVEQLASWRLREFSIEFTRELDLPSFLLNNLHSLELAGYGKAGISSTTLAAIASSPQLRILKLRHCLNGMSQPMRTIVALGEQLIDLDVSYNLRTKDLTGGDLLCLNALRSLRSLNVSFTRVNSRDLVSLSCLTALRELRASACEIFPEHIASLAKTLTCLTLLDVSSSWELTEFGRDLSPSSFPHLQFLLLNYSAKLTSLVPLTAVKELSLAGSPLAAPLIEAAGQLSNLTRLDMSCYSPGNKLTAGSLTALLGLSALQSLNLGGAVGVTDAGIEMLTQLTSLLELDLNGCGVTNAGLEHLSNLGSLRRLRCSRCAKVSLAQIKDTAVRLCLYKGHRREDGQVHSLIM